MITERGVVLDADLLFLVHISFILSQPIAFIVLGSAAAEHADRARNLAYYSNLVERVCSDVWWHIFEIFFVYFLLFTSGPSCSV